MENFDFWEEHFDPKLQKLVGEITQADYPANKKTPEYKEIELDDKLAKEWIQEVEDYNKKIKKANGVVKCKLKKRKRSRRNKSTPRKKRKTLRRNKSIPRRKRKRSRRNK